MQALARLYWDDASARRSLGSTSHREPTSQASQGWFEVVFAGCDPGGLDLPAMYLQLVSALFFRAFTEAAAIRMKWSLRACPGSLGSFGRGQHSIGIRLALKASVESSRTWGIRERVIPTAQPQSGRRPVDNTRSRAQNRRRATFVPVGMARPCTSNGSMGAVNAC